MKRPTQQPTPKKAKPSTVYIGYNDGVKLRYVKCKSSSFFVRLIKFLFQ